MIYVQGVSVIVLDLVDVLVTVNAAVHATVAVVVTVNAILTRGNEKHEQMERL